MGCSCQLRAVCRVSLAPVPWVLAGAGGGRRAAPAAAESWGFSSPLWNEEAAALQEMFACCLHLSVPPLHSQGLGWGTTEGSCLEKVHLNDNYCCCAGIICASQGTGLHRGEKFCAKALLKLNKPS